jgi:hypothetical protein
MPHVPNDTEAILLQCDDKKVTSVVLCVLVRRSHDGLYDPQMNGSEPEGHQSRYIFDRDMSGSSESTYCTRTSNDFYSAFQPTLYRRSQVELTP